MTTDNRLARVLGLRESIAMTVGTVVGVGLFTCGSSQIGFTGSRIIGITLVAFLISVWPCLLYGEMAAMLPGAGGTYSFARRGIGRLTANLAAWNYIISVVAIGSGEALAFSNYFSLLVAQFGMDMSGLDPRMVAILVTMVFLVVNYLGIRSSGKMQMLFILFFWACAVSWFLYMIPHVHAEYFGTVAFSELPPFEEMMYIFGLVWWCYTGFETCVSMGGETRFPQYTIPRALKISIVLVFVSNALFQWFLVGVVPGQFYELLSLADAPYAEGLRAAGFVGFPIILLCLAIAFGGDLSAINPGIAAPARYVYSMACDNAIPRIFARIHPKFNVPHVALIFIGVVNILLIASGSIVYIASVSLVSLAICYIIGSMSYVGLKRRLKNARRPYVAPYGVLGAVLTMLVYVFMLCFADRTALLTALVICVLCTFFWFFYSRRKATPIPDVADEIGVIEEPTPEEKARMDREYARWKYVSAALAVVAMLLFAWCILVGKEVITL